jgi:hypothetical protein
MDPPQTPETSKKSSDGQLLAQITDVRGCNNLANHYRRYIKDFAKIALPLTNLLKGSPVKGSPIGWTEKEEAAFRALKKALTSEPVLRHPRMGQPFIIDTDSSQYYLGAVLQQTFRDPDDQIRLHPIAYDETLSRDWGSLF